MQYERYTDLVHYRKIKILPTILYATFSKPSPSFPRSNTNAMQQDSDTQPNTTASSVAGDVQQLDGRKRRSEAFQLRKSVFGKKHGHLNESKVRSRNLLNPKLGRLTKHRKMIPFDDFATS